MRIHKAHLIYPKYHFSFKMFLDLFLVVAFLPSAFAFNYAIQFSQSCISRGHGNGSSPYTSSKPLSFAYEDGLMKNTLLKVFLATKKIPSLSSSTANYLPYIQSAMDVLLSPNGTIGGGYVLSQYQLDSIEEGPSLLYLSRSTNESTRYLSSIQELVTQLESQPTTSEGAYWHKAIYPYQIWLDGLFMAEPFRSSYISSFSPNPSTNETISDVLLQFQQVMKHMRAPGNLLYHAYDEMKVQPWANNITGCSPLVWGRAVGWFALALLDTLDYLPQNSNASLQLQEYVRYLALGIAAVQDKNSSLWFQLPTEPLNPLNYVEASASAMFIAFFLKAERLGYLGAQEEGGSYGTLARNAYDRFVDRFVVWNDTTEEWDLTGTVSVGSPNTDYLNQTLCPIRTNDMKGEAPFILASLEVEELV